MAVKRAEYMSVESAENFILQHEDSAKRLFNRYRRSVQARKLTFDLHKERGNEGYKRLQKALEYSKNGMTAESLSYLAYTLASQQTSYTDFLRIRKQTMKTLNLEFGEEGKKFLKNYQEFQEFTDFMETARDLKLTSIISSDQLIVAMNNMRKTLGKKVTWKELKEKIFGMTLEEQIEFINNNL